MSSTPFNSAAKQAAAKKAAEETQQQLSALFGRDTVEVDAKAYDGHNFEFLFSNRPQKNSRNNVTQGLEAAREMQTLFKNKGITAGLTAKIWGPTSTLQPFVIEKSNPFEKLSSNCNFDAPAEYIMNEARAGRSKNYIVVTDGNLYAGNVKEIALSLAFLALTPNASLDFIVPGNTSTGVDKLLAALQDTPAAKQVHVTKVPSEVYVSLAVKNAIQDRVQPPVKKKEEKPAPPKKSKLFGIFPRDY